MEIKKQVKIISIEDLSIENLTNEEMIIENLTDEEMAMVNGGSMWEFLNPQVYDPSQMFTYSPLMMFANM